MNQLIAYLMENLIIDFQGALNLDMVREFLRNDDDRDAKVIYAKIVQDGSVEDMLFVLADCLRDSIRTGIDERVIRQQLKIYSES